MRLQSRTNPQISDGQLFPIDLYANIDYMLGSTCRDDTDICSIIKEQDVMVIAAYLANHNPNNNEKNYNPTIATVVGSQGVDALKNMSLMRLQQATEKVENLQNNTNGSTSAECRPSNKISVRFSIRTDEQVAFLLRNMRVAMKAGAADR